MGLRCTSLGVLALLTGCAAAPEPAFLWERQLGGAWCYRTIADPDCYPAPLPGAAHRLIASGPAVYFSWRPNPRFRLRPGHSDRRLSPALDPAGTLIDD